MGETREDRGSVGGAAREVVLLRQRMAELERVNGQLEERLALLVQERSPSEVGACQRREHKLRESEERYRTVVVEFSHSLRL